MNFDASVLVAEVIYQGGCVVDDVVQYRVTNMPGTCACSPFP